MTYEKLTILLPCHSLEDFPLHYVGDEAGNLLHAWTALWHPALIHSAQDVPSWHRADDPPQDITNRLLVIPQTAEPLLLAGWAKRAANEGGCVVREFSTREEVLQAALPKLDNLPRFDDDLVADFLALGYTYLEEELLTRQMRYMSNLDEPHFRSETLAAAEAACRGDVTTARDKLQACFDVLAEARDRFYPVDAYFIDLVLLAESTPPEVIERELAKGSPTNLLASAGLLRKLAGNSSLLPALQAAVTAGHCTIVGGDLDEGPLLLQPVEMTQARLQLATADYQQLIQTAPHTFARRRFGLNPTLPQALARCGYRSALHFTLDDGQFPRGEQARCRWRGPGPSGVDALTRIPLDAARPETFVGLCERIGETMDLDHVATLVFARWPGQELPWFEDLHRAQKYAPVLGRFVTLDKYFEVDASVPSSNFTADRYRSPYLKQAIIRKTDNPTSAAAAGFLLRQHAEDLHTLAVLLRLLDNSAAAAEMLQRAKANLEAIDRAGVEQRSVAGDESSQPQMSLTADEVATGLEAAWLRSAKSDAKSDAGSSSSTSPHAIMVFNPNSTSRRLAVDVAALETLPDAGGESPVLTVQAEPPLALVEVPASGYAWLSPGSGKVKAPVVPKKRGWFGRKTLENPPLADEETLTVRNEFAEVKVDRHTGAIQALRDYKHRGNRLSQQIALRRKAAQPRTDDDFGPRDDGEYSVMAADDVQVTIAGTVWGEIVSRGQILDKKGERLAGFEQTVRVTRGVPVIDLSIKLDIDEEPRPDPWNSYYACRFALPSSGLMWRRNVGMFARETELKRFEAPLFVEADTGHQRTAILTGGLPYHRIVDGRFLDTLLVCRGDARREFHLGIGLDLKYPVRDAVSFLSEPLQHTSQLGPPSGPPSGWLFHVDAPNVVVTHWDAIIEDDRAIGFRARLIETEEKAVRAKLRAMRNLKSARLTEFTGSPLADLTVEGDAVQLNLDGCDWVEVEAYWA